MEDVAIPYADKERQKAYNKEYRKKYYQKNKRKNTSSPCWKGTPGPALP